MVLHLGRESRLILTNQVLFLVYRSDITDQLEVLQADLESVKDILTSNTVNVPGFDSSALFSVSIICHTADYFIIPQQSVT